MDYMLHESKIDGKYEICHHCGRTREEHKLLKGAHSFVGMAKTPTADSAIHHLLGNHMVKGKRLHALNDKEIIDNY